MAIDVEWRDAVRGACDAVVAAADVGFVWNDFIAFDAAHPALLWEAEPARFAARYPDSRIEDSYGDQWPGVSCIDYWIYVDPVTMTARLSMEGWNGADTVVELTGDGAVDGRRLAAEFAHVLGVEVPRLP
ncbi:MAG TPA: hypothetical protein VFS29_00630 [Motilibacteraceae bacterium]|nr:hypothetical protein [Motilibacteraceae bacterium]